MNSAFLQKVAMAALIPLIALFFGLWVVPMVQAQSINDDYSPTDTSTSSDDQGDDTSGSMFGNLQNTDALDDNSTDDGEDTSDSDEVAEEEDDSINGDDSTSALRSNDNENDDESADHFTADLQGSEEVPSVDTDSTGDFHLWIDEEGEDGWFTLDVEDGENITAAHIHCAEEGENGPIVVTLFTASGSSTDVDGRLASSTIDGGDIESTGLTCETPIEDIDDLEQAAEDGELYANVHSTEYPNGLIRGQIEEDDDNGTSTDDNGSDDDDTTNGTSTDDDNGTSTDGIVNPVDLDQIFSDIFQLYVRLLDLYGQLLSIQ